MAGGHVQVRLHGGGRTSAAAAAAARHQARGQGLRWCYYEAPAQHQPSSETTSVCREVSEGASCSLCSR